MDSHTYGVRGEHGPEIIWVGQGDYIRPAMDTTTTLTAGYLLAAGMPISDLLGMVNTLDDADPDDGAAGVPAMV